MLAQQLFNQAVIHAQKMWITLWTHPGTSRQTHDWRGLQHDA
jgi:hypothetical protein